MKYDGLEEKKRRTLKEIFDSSLFFRVLLGLMVFACTLFATAPRKEHEMQKLVINQLSPVNLCADFDFLVVDKARTEASRAVMERRVPNYYQIRTEQTRKILQRSEEFFREIKKRENAERTGQNYKVAPENLPGQWVKELSAGALNFFLRLADNPPRMERYSAQLQKFLQGGVLSEDDFEEVLANERSIRIVDLLQRRSETPSSRILTPGRCAKQMIALLPDGVESSLEKKILENVERTFIRILEGGNLVYDALFTESQKQEAARQVPAIHRQVFAGTMLLHKGAVLTAEDLELYERYMAEKAKRRIAPVWQGVLRENFLPCLILIIVLCLYLRYMQADLLYHNRSLWLLGIILILGMLLNRFFFDGLLILAEHTDYPHNLIYLCLPLGFTATLISVIFGIRTSLICGLFVSVVAALACPNPFQTVLLGFLISSGGSLAVRRTLNYRSFFLNCFWGTASGALMVVFMMMIREQNLLKMFWNSLIPLSAVAGMGLVTAMLTQMTLILLEIFFDLNTTMSLMICCDYNHPLLKEMQLKAPGTYHHCLMVATLAEQAAQDAGLDPVKARACGLYHDIGKIVQPEFFIENNRSGVDMHRDMDPTMSAMIIRSHVVTHGVELARKYKLKKILFDAITQHHGNDLIAYFHKKAQDLSPGGHVSEKDFRYPCELPSDKEICVVMLSDCCEAASRSLEHPTPEALSELISEIIRKKIRSGQLDDSKLTMSELSRIRKSFVNTLQHMYHGRIAYPKDENQDENDLFVASGKTLQKT